MAIWAVVESYYKNAEFKLHIFYNDEELLSFLRDEMLEFVDNCLDLDLDDLIEKAIEIGENIIDNEEGWGIREIRQI